MQISTSCLKLPALEQIINSDPLVVPPNASVRDVMTFLLQGQKGTRGEFCAVVEEQGKILGILAQQDVIKLATLEKRWEFFTVADVVEKNHVVLAEAQYNDVFQVCSLLRQYETDYLLVEDQQGSLKGVITSELILNSLQGSHIWQQGFVGEVMNTDDFSVTPQTSLLQAARLMSENERDWVIIAQDVQPLGLVTTKDIIQHQLNSSDLAQVQALAVMNTLPSKVLAEDSLDSAWQKIQQNSWQPLLVTNSQGALLGTLTQASFLRCLEPREMYSKLELLYRENQQLRSEKAQLLKSQSHETEAELEGAKDQLQAVLDAMPGTISWIDSDLCYLGVNKQLASLFNKPTEGFVGKKIGFFKENDEFGYHMERFFASSQQESSLEVEMQVGDSFNNYLVVTRKYNHNRAAVAVGVNITDRQKTEMALVKSAATNRALINSIPDLMFCFNHDGIFLDYKAAKDYEAAVSPEDFLGKRVNEVLPPQISQSVLQCIKRALQTKEIQSFEYQLPRSYQDNKIRDWEARLFVSNENEVMAIIRDITERKRSETELRRQSLKSRLFAEISLKIRQSLQLEEILQTTVTEVQQIFQVDRVLIYHCLASGLDKVIMEEVLLGWPKTLGMSFPQEVSFQNHQDSWRQGEVLAIADLEKEYGKTSPSIVAFWQNWFVKAKLVVPILQQEKLWGLIIVHQCSSCRHWSNFETELLQQLADQVGIAISQAQLLKEQQESEAMIRASLQEKEVLLKEIHHRVKNNLQVISSLFSLQSYYLEDSKALRVLEDSQSRVKAMALIHEKIYNSQDLSKVNFAKYIQDLANYLFHAYEPNPQVELEIDVEPVSLNLDTATPCGLLINEVISNALKYAFPNKKKGRIWIKLYYLNQEKMVLEIGDNGVGFPPNLDLEETESLGLQLVKDLAQQLKGKLEINCHQGTRLKITFSELQYRRRM
ncbi:MAG: histidine kinase dimerization/phosphoacceptor domain -containing protein [Spirulinaceae cyanobacterium]